LSLVITWLLFSIHSTLIGLHKELVNFREWMVSFFLPRHEHGISFGELGQIKGSLHSIEAKMDKHWSKLVDCLYGLRIALQKISERD